MSQSFKSIPYFLAGFVTIILVFSMILWQKLGAGPTDSIDDTNDQTIWLLLGLLLVAVFGLGAFVMYALVHFL
ncbi:MAG: hypothetical protein FOGNACKC_05946 [Anaerolineae bacterium]|mgnify:CR=1 FL=1|nr:hypothetical protein [Anaerolineae bacterium]